MSDQRITPIECSECGGYYYAARHIGSSRPLFVMCGDCGHELTRGDIDLDEGETLAWDDEGRMGYTSGSPLDFDSAEALGYDPTGRTGPEAPKTWEALTDEQRAFLRIVLGSDE